MELRQENKKETIEQMSNEALIEKCDKWILDLCRSGGKDWTLEIPANFERDPDMLFSELIKRFKEKSGQSMVEEVPPGIIAFVNNSDTIVIQKGMDYKTWVKYHLNDLCSPASIIHSVSVGGVAYSVSEKLTVGIIKSLEWIKDGWFADVEDNRGGIYPYVLKSFLKLPQPHERKIVGWSIKRLPNIPTLPINFNPSELLNVFTPVYSEPNPPVCELPDENGKMIPMHEGDKVWYVQKDFYLGWGVAQNVDLSNPYRTYFATEAAANQFVKYNKPVYSESLIEDMCNASDISAVNRMYTEYCKKHNL